MTSTFSQPVGEGLSQPSAARMGRRMAALFLLALFLICAQAVRTRPVLQPAFEVATLAGEQRTPLAVPSWRPPADPPAEPAARQAFLDQRALDWPGIATRETADGGCQAYVRVSSQHWVRRPFLPASTQPWQRFFLPAAAFLDDGDPLEAGELREEGLGAEVEVFCNPRPNGWQKPQ